MLEPDALSAAKDVTWDTELSAQLAAEQDLKPDALSPDALPTHIEVRGAKVHNLKDLDLDIPLHQVVAIAGVSGSGKSSLALGVLYAEGSRRYLEALSAYTRRRLTQATKPEVKSVRYIPAAIALHQRPTIPSLRSTFGTSSELLNSLRLLFSRCAAHRCPKCGHYLAPSLKVAAEQALECPHCGAQFMGPAAQDLSFNAQGACPHCQGTGTVRTVNLESLVPDDSLTIDEGAVAPWQSLMWSLMTEVCRAMGVRTDVPFRELTAAEKDIVYHGPALKQHILYRPKNPKNSAESTELDFTYYNAVYTVENALAKVKDESGMKRIAKFLTTSVCPHCQGTRLSDAARAPLIDGHNLAWACTLPLSELSAWLDAVPSTLPDEMRPMAQAIIGSFKLNAARLTALGLSYLSLERPTSTLSTGERQRVQLARVVRNRTSGVLYVLDEPSIGLHPHNLQGLEAVLHELIADGNSVVLVDHETQLLRHADYLIELGPGAGAQGGTLIYQGPVAALLAPTTADSHSLIAPYLQRPAQPALAPDQRAARYHAAQQQLAQYEDALTLTMGPIHTVSGLTLRLKRHALNVITGVSGSGKTTVILESLVPALQAQAQSVPASATSTPEAAGAPDAASVPGAERAPSAWPTHVLNLEHPWISQVQVIDSSPIGTNIRSTVATYTGIHDALRKVMAKEPEAQALGLKASDFSYNTGRLRCPECEGTGAITLDVQFLPDVDIPCPRCHGSRYAEAAQQVRLHRVAADAEPLSMPQLMGLEVSTARRVLAPVKAVTRRLELLELLGLGYLTLGEATTLLSGGEAQRLKLASHLEQSQEGTLFVFDEPTIGLHPSDVQRLIAILRQLIARGATVVVIEHDLDLINASDFIVDLGPEGGSAGGRIVAEGSPAMLRYGDYPQSHTAHYLQQL